MTTYTEAERFLQAVFPDYGNHAIFAFSVLPTGMAHVRSLDRLDGTRDCYWSVAAFPDDKGTKRVLTRALEVRALVIDDVGTKILLSDVIAKLGEPTAVIETSANNYQLTYKLAAPVPVEDWARFFAEIEALVGTKLEGKDGVHLFRLPMGINNKPGRGGFAPKLISLDPNKTCSRTPSSSTRSKSAPSVNTSGPGPSTVEPRIKNIREIVNLVPNTSSTEYDDWVARAHQIKALALDASEAEIAFDEYSAKRPDKYDPAETARVWGSLHSVSRTTGLVLLKDAEAADPANFARVMNAEAGAVFDDGTIHPAANIGGGGYSLSQRAMAAEIVKLRAGDLGWMSNSSNGTHWATFDPVLLRWVIEPHDMLMRTAVREEIDACWARMIAAGETPPKSLNDAKWQNAVQSLLLRNAGLRIPFERFDADLDMFGVPGGVVRLTAGGAVEERGAASQMVSKAMTVKPAPAGVKGVVWEKFLDDFTEGDRELRAWWQAYMGYCLTGHVREHKVVFVYGPGGNGKSVFLDTIAEVMGPYHSRSGHTLFMATQNGHKHMAAVADLVGARIVTAPDVPVGAAWDMALVKSLTGGGAFKAQFMRENWFQFTPQFKLVLAGNEKPQLNGVDDAVRRRFLLVPAMNRPKVVNKHLVDVLRQELPAVLRWMIDGWEAYNVFDGLPPCKIIETETSEYMAQADVWTTWREATLKKAPGDKARHRITDLWNRWDTYRAAEGMFKTAPVNKQAFATKLREAGLSLGRDNQGGYVDEITLTKSAAAVF